MVALALICTVSLVGIIIDRYPGKLDLSERNAATSDLRAPQPGIPTMAEVLKVMPGRELPPPVPSGQDPEAHERSAREREIDARFRQAVSMLHVLEYDYAVAALHRVLELEPRMPEAHVNMGFALLGLEQHKAAYDFFESATVLKPDQANAYYGMGIALESLGELEAAMGAMNTFVHLSKEESPHVNRARAAVWEWRAALAERNELLPESPGGVSPGIPAAGATDEAHANGGDAPTGDTIPPVMGTTSPASAIPGEG